MKDRSEAVPVWVKGEDNKADLLTKCFKSGEFKKKRNYMESRSFSLAESESDRKANFLRRLLSLDNKCVRD